MTKQKKPEKPEKPERPDWAKIKTEYIADANSSYRKLAEKYNIPFSTIKDRAVREKWFSAKKKIQEKVVKNTAHKIASRKASRIIRKELDPALEAAARINQLVLETLHLLPLPPL